ncbi:MAG: DUF72 domain-containing protein [Bacillota bacterium]|nr:DUF72 domain-containing protein [Bacillota bacterium]
MVATILVGTGGYSYEDWRGVFYPADLPRNRMLEFYSREFDFVELNTTYYRQPSRPMLRNMVRMTPPRFSFAVKAYRGITHERDRPRQELRTMLDALEPLRQEGRLGCVLLQFPTSFRYNGENVALLRDLGQDLRGTPAVVEFRHQEWLREDVFHLLEESHLGFTCVDEPAFRTLVPPAVRATADVAYVRFHGRNYQKWWHHEEPSQRYDYLYTREELAEWVPRIRLLERQAGKVFVSMNNHRRGQAVINGRMIKELLELTWPTPLVTAETVLASHSPALAGPAEKPVRMPPQATGRRRPRP